MAIVKRIFQLACVLLFHTSVSGVPTSLEALLPRSATSVAISVLPTTTTAYNFTVSRQSPAADNLATGSGNGILVLPLPAVATASAGYFTITSVPPVSSADAPRTFGIEVYDAPTIIGVRTSLAGNGLTTAGLADVMVVVDQTAAPIPSSSIDVTVVCNADGATAPPTSLLESQFTSGLGYTYRISSGAVTVSVIPQGQPNAGAYSIRFRSQADPSTDCDGADIYLSYNGGSHWHWVNTTVPVTFRQPVKIASFYPSELEIRWPQSHNRARIAMSAAYQTAVDSSLYYTDAYDYVGDGTAVALQYFAKAIAQNATMFLCVGGEYKPAARAITPTYPGISVLVMSTLRNVLPPYPNLATATGRMYEAIRHAGFVAASVSNTGILGMILAIDGHPTSYAFVNAFLLGARAAAKAGVAGFNASSSANLPRVESWFIGDFNLPWNEKTATEDLLRKGVDVIMSVTDNSVMIQQIAIAAGASTIGFNADDRLTLGDSVLISALYEWQPIYLEFVRRILNNETFGGTFYDGGLGFGVSLTGMSPTVPLPAQRLLQSALAASVVEDGLEEVFCGDLFDSAGVLRLNGTTGQNGTGINNAGVRGINGQWCLHADDIHSMDWAISGVNLDPYPWVPPPLPVEPVWTIPPSLQGGMAVLPAFSFAFALVFAAMVARYAKEAAIRYSSPIFLLVCNAGAVIYGATLLYTAYNGVSDDTCNGRLWASGFAFALLFGSLFAKTHRLSRLFNNTKLRRLKLTNAYVFYILGIILLAEIAVLLIITYVFPSVLTHVRVPSATSFDGYLSFDRCAAGGQYKYAVDGNTLLAAYHFIILLWGGYLAFRVRNVPDGFNESRYMGWAIYNCVVCELVGFILIPSLDTDPQSVYVQAAIRFGVPPVATLMLLYFPKAYAIWSNAAIVEGSLHDNANNKSSPPGSMVGDGSGPGGSGSLIKGSGQHNNNNNHGRVGSGGSGPILAGSSGGLVGNIAGAGGGSQQMQPVGKSGGAASSSAGGKRGVVVPLNTGANQSKPNSRDPAPGSGTVNGTPDQTTNQHHQNAVTLQLGTMDNRANLESGNQTLDGMTGTAPTMGPVGVVDTQFHLHKAYDRAGKMKGRASDGVGGGSGIEVTAYQNEGGSVILDQSHLPGRMVSGEEDGEMVTMPQV